MTGSPPHSSQFEGRVALVTGAASGIGRASAIAFAQTGARVVVADIESDGGEETVDLIVRAGGEASFVNVDISCSDQVESLLQQVVSIYGRIDYAHNNAGMMSSGIPIDEYDEDLWDAVVNVNLKGTWLCMKHEIKWMRQQESGSIVNTASIAGMRGAPRASLYSATKHGVLGLTRSAAQELAPFGIRVNAICPSWVHTPPIETMFALIPGLQEHLTTLTPSGRLATSQDIANAVVWLCSEASAYVTGHSLVIDGGTTS